MASTKQAAPPPPLFRRHLRRPRLTRVLDEATSQIVLLTAPPGFGKTILVEEWLQAGPEAVWYRATPASADVAAFSAALADVVGPIVPGAGERVRQRLRVADTPERAARPLAELLAEDLADWPQDVRLVIDDYHLVGESQPVEDFMDWLLTLAPVRVVATTRKRPRWASARRMLYGEIVEITQAELAMTPEEAARVLEGGRSPDAVRALVAQAHGWPALIGLAALSTTAELPEERVSEALFRYFAEELLRQQPPEGQQFMLVASLPASVSAATARDVLEIPAPEPLIERLTDEGLLHQSDAEQLRFHPLFREFLRRKLETDQPELARELSAQAIIHSRAAGQWEDAFELAVHAGRLDEAAEIIGDAAQDLLAAGRLETIEAWSELVRPNVAESPGALLANAEVALRQGRFSDSRASALDVAARILDSDPRAAWGWNVAGRAARLLSHNRDALEYHTRARAVSTDPTSSVEALWGMLLASIDLEELEIGATLLDELQLAAPPDLTGRLRVAAGRVVVGTRSGSLAGIQDHVSPLLPFAEEGKDPMINSGFLVNAAYLDLARAEYSRAVAGFRRALQYCEHLRLDFAVPVCLIFRAHAEIGLRAFRDANDTIATVEARGGVNEDPWVGLALQAARVRLLLARGEAAQALSVTPRPAGKEIAALYGEYLALLAIAAASSSQHSLGHAYATRAREITRALESTSLARLAECVLQFDSPTIDEDLGSLVLDLSRDGFLDGLVVAYRAFPPLLRRLAAHDTVAPLLGAVILRSNDHALARAADIPLHEDEPPRRTRLTRREAEVLRLMAAGLSNPAIARELYISLGTVKVHVHHILEKLGARTRLDAVLKAQEASEID